MPEFQLDFGGPEAAARFAALDSFTQGYVTCLFFTAPDDSPEGDGHANTLEYASLAELSESAWSAIEADCQRFQKENHDSILAIENYEVRHKASEAGSDSLEAAGRDFCYTRNGHGCGFWDGDWSEEFGDKLAEASRKFHGQDLYRGDNGELYVMSG